MSAESESWIHLLNILKAVDVALQISIDGSQKCFILFIENYLLYGTVKTVLQKCQSSETEI